MVRISPDGPGNERLVRHVQQPGRVKEPGQSCFHTCVCSSIKTINKSDRLSYLFFKTCKRELGSDWRSKNDAQHRWGLNESVLDVGFIV